MAVLSELSRKIDSKKFNVSGGGLNGDITLSKNHPHISSIDPLTYFRIGSAPIKIDNEDGFLTENGASLWFYGAKCKSEGGVSHAYDGGFRLRCATETGSETSFCDLIGDTNGSLKWSIKGSGTYIVDSAIRDQSETVWYKKYADGWVEQGGTISAVNGTVTFPIGLVHTNYTAICVHNGTSAKGEGFVHCYNKTTTSISFGLSYSTSGMAGMSWYVCGRWK